MGRIDRKFTYKEIIENFGASIPGILKEKKVELKDLEFDRCAIEDKCDDPIMLEMWDILYGYKRLLVEVDSLKELNDIRLGKKDMKFDVEVAKRVPIDSLFNWKKRKGRQVSCPLHGEDKNPSMTLYIKTNSFFCFTCKAGGSPIDFIMKLYGFDTKKAIEWLNENSTTSS